MKRFMLTFVLAIAAGVWTLSNALCLGSIPDAMYQQYTTVSGTIQALPLPCEPGEDCPLCLTEAIVTNDKTYYLTTKNQQVADFLEQIQTSPVPAIYLLPLKATASGTPYQRGSFDYLLISSLNELSVEYFSDQQENKLPSLCDEWNVWHESFESFGPISFDKVVKYQLTTDTLINGQQYVKLTSDKDSPYLGAMREGNNRDIYYVPAGSTHEYLLYAFNAQVGDTITNLHIGGMGKEEGYKAVVRSISDSNPRIFTIGVSLSEENEYPITWIEGVGSPQTPYGLAVVPTIPADIGVFNLLCAYKNGEQVYVSEMGKQYGCEYNQTPLLPSLCDEWNVLQFRSHMGASPNEYYTQHYRLTSDTVINGQFFRKLYKENSYSGAMREGNNRDIYYVPADSTHEYLLYAFNAQTGDTLTNAWFGTQNNEELSIKKATILEITPTSPRTFVIDAECLLRGVHETIHERKVWIEGVGLNTAPDGGFFTPLAGGFSNILLCAYKNGEQVYVSDWGEQYGCEYNDDSHSTPIDTIPLFIKDGPGSSTVEPVDPNLIYATLSKDILSIYVLRDLEINMVLYKTPSANHAPAVKRTIKATTFTDSISTTLTESGTYTLELTNPAWDYTIVGTFDYQLPQAIENTSANTPSATKILKDGRLFLRYKGQMYNVQGQQVQ